MRPMVGAMSIRLRSALGVIAIGALLLQACEDDPILGPTDEDSGGGSYGRMLFVTPAARIAPPGDSAEIHVAAPVLPANPAIF